MLEKLPTTSFRREVNNRVNFHDRPPVTYKEPNYENYWYPDKHLVFNKFSKAYEVLHPEDHREGSTKKGKLLGRPVVRVVNPQNPDECYHLIPCYTVERAFKDITNRVHKRYELNPEEEKVISLLTRKDYNRYRQNPYSITKGGKKIYKIERVHKEKKQKNQETTKLAHSKSVVRELSALSINSSRALNRNPLLPDDNPHLYGYQE